MSSLKLIKSTSDAENPRNDNSDKKELFAKDQHLLPASFHKSEWGFVRNETVRDNIAYQMQYLEFNVRLYNEYQIYLTIESLLCKNILITIAGVIESALRDVLEQNGKDLRSASGGESEFMRLIDEAYRSNIIDKNTRDIFHDLRKIRNKIHLSALTDPEYSAYSIDDVNPYLHILETFRQTQSLPH